MRAYLFSALAVLALWLVAAVLAGAEDLAAVCKVYAPSSLAPNAVGMDQFCSCVDKEAAGNGKLRSAFVASFTITDMDSRRATMSDDQKAVVAKCGAH